LGILIFEMLAGWVIENSGSLLNPFFYTYTNSNLLLYRYPPFFDDNPFGIYEKILAGKLRFPSHFDPTAKDLVKKLLTSDRSKRLGNLKGGPDDIKKHKWFRGVDWQGLLNKTVQVKRNLRIHVQISFGGILNHFFPSSFLRHRLSHPISIPETPPTLRNMLILNRIRARTATWIHLDTCFQVFESPVFIYIVHVRVPFASVCCTIFCNHVGSVFSF
jgi:serine/threonine protein kinase